MHSMKNIDGKESNAAKEVNIAIEFNKFKDTLFNKKIIRHDMRRIQGKKHKIGTDKIYKISLSVFDDKRFVLNNVMIFKRLLKSQMITNKNKYVQVNS